MKTYTFPVVSMPQEFLNLLKNNLAVVSQPHMVIEALRPNRAMYLMLEQGLVEFDDGRGLEKIINVLGWSNFRDRAASIFISKRLYGNYPRKTNIELVEEIKNVEIKFSDHGVNSYSRCFLLGFYIKLANIELHEKEGHLNTQISISEEVSEILKISQGRSDRIDWLILITMHLINAFGPKSLTQHLIAGRKLSELYPLMSLEAREIMHENLLAYGASIQESDLFIYDRI